MYGILILAAFEMFGVASAYRLFSRRCALTRVWLGLVLGLVEMMWFPSIFAFFIGFTLPAQQYALALSGLIACLCALWPRARAPKTALDSPVPPILLAAIVIPVAVLAGYLQYTHTLRDVNGALHVGQSTYGDLCMHLSFATGLIGQSYPPEYTLLPGTVLGYPFLADALSATMLSFGTPLPLSFTVPGTLMTALIMWGFVTLAWEIARSKPAVVIACLLMVFNGGLGFIYVLDGLGADLTPLTDALTGFYQAPANMPANNVYWVNMLCDLIVPQRTLMAGWMCLMPAVYLLKSAIITRDKRTFMALGLLAGAMPMIHTHSFLALGLISLGALIYCLIYDRRNIPGYALYAFIVALMAVPQLILWTFPQALSSGSVRLHFNWINNSGGLTDGYIWFWVKNVGLVFLVLVPAALNAPKRLRPLIWGAACLFTVSEFIVFQPNSYDNNKLFYAAFLLMLPFVGKFIVKVMRMLGGVRGRSILLGAFMLVSTLSGAISIARECVSDYEIFSRSQVRAAEFIRDNTPEDAVFLTSTQHNNPVPTLTGRSIVCGSSIYLFYHGLDYSRQYTDHVLMLAYPDKYEALYAEYEVDYIFVSTFERSVMTADYTLIADSSDWRESYWIDLPAIERKYPKVFECGEWFDNICVYAVSPRAQKLAVSQ